MRQLYSQPFIQHTHYLRQTVTQGDAKRKRTMNQIAQKHAGETSAFPTMATHRVLFILTICIEQCHHVMNE